MTQAHFNGVSGLIAFSTQLNNVSQNISNMNTPGYKGKDSFLKDVESNNGMGLGVSYQGTGTRSKNGDSKQTGNQTDLFINGKGYFILKDSKKEIFYTRAGQFKFNEEGFLVDQSGMYNVMGFNGNKLVAININNYESLPPAQTTVLDVNGILSTAETTPYKLNNVNIYDSTGSLKSLSISFEKQSDNTTVGSKWSYTITDEKNKILNTGVINFTLAGTVLEQFLDIELNFDEGKQNLKLDIGGVSVVSVGNSSVQANATDGGPRAGIVGYNFGQDGILEISYNNGQKKKTSQALGLASFSDETKLIQDQNAFFHKPENVKVNYSKPDLEYFGKIQGGYIELANIDLAQEFGNILIIQRGYQASSRVMNVANEMLEQLYNSSRGG
ncbi:flagellar hook-basal body complex protein [Acinetobacter sp. 3657]|uniref:flagellar hook-basal body complex protein n=1 Tax=Acinetobacter sp. 3657 TaxID=2817764 RepID=UPI00285E80DE|nr:flagellar hook protein FlgE [Prolinoborus sp. 3657]